MSFLIRPLSLALLFHIPLAAQETGSPIPAGLAGPPRTWHLPEGATARLGKGSLADGNHAVDFTSDGRYLAVGSSIGAWLYEVPKNRFVTLLPTVSRLTSVSFSPDGTTLAAGLHNNTIALWQVKTGRRIGTLRQDPIYFPITVFSPDGATLAAGSNDGTVQLWDMGSRTVVAVLEGHTRGVEGLVFSPDGTMLASSGDNNIKLWDVPGRREIATLKGHRDRVEALAFSPDGSTLASGAWDGTARMWDVATRKQIATLDVHVTGASSVAFSPVWKYADNRIRKVNDTLGRHHPISSQDREHAQALDPNDGLFTGRPEPPRIHGLRRRHSTESGVGEHYQAQRFSGGSFDGDFTRWRDRGCRNRDRDDRALGSVGRGRTFRN